MSYSWKLIDSTIELFMQLTTAANFKVVKGGKESKQFGFAGSGKFFTLSNFYKINEISS